MRTNIVIDDEIMQQAIAISGIKTKRELVDTAIREFISRRLQKNLMELRGEVQFYEGYNYKAMRENS